MELLSPEFIVSVGFPAALCVYLVVRVENTLKDVNKNVACNNALVRSLLVKMGVDLEVLQEVK